MVQPGLGINERPYSKHDHSKKSWTHGSSGRTPVRKQKALSSNPTTKNFFKTHLFRHIEKQQE
jgi:hypothetical protein